MDPADSWLRSGQRGGFLRRHGREVLRHSDLALGLLRRGPAQAPLHRRDRLDRPGPGTCAVDVV